MDQIGIGKVLRRHIQMNYKTQKEAADKWNVSPSFVSAVLSGAKRPTSDMLSEIGYKCAEYSPQFVKVKK